MTRNKLRRFSVLAVALVGAAYVGWARGLCPIILWERSRTARVR